jgi:DNA repair protein RecN (Recombination protein N)
VTHLPQVAAYADRHLVVDKTAGTGAAGNGAGRTSSRVRTLAEGDRIVELARMLAGLDDTDTGRAHAEELLGAARAHREADRAAISATNGAATNGAATNGAVTGGAGPVKPAANVSATGAGPARKAARKVPARG